MSAGNFITSKYETDNGTVIPIRIQEETLALTIEGTVNAAPAAASTKNFGSARVGGGKRQTGLRARGVTVKFTAGNAPTGYKEDSPIRLPWLVGATHLPLADGNTGTYLGAPIVVVAPYQEERN